MTRIQALAAAAALLLAPAGAAAAAPLSPPTGDASLEAPAPRASDVVVAIAAWAIRTNDPGGRPFAVVDKAAARVYVFGADGKLKGEAPALLGSAWGDRSEPYVGDRELSTILPHERTTPAGRFQTAWGKAPGGKRTLWVDYATAVSIHPLASVLPGEKRETRLASATPGDNRITFGCINVAPAFFNAVVQPNFRDSGVFYVLPEAQSLQSAFPGFQPPPGLALAAR